jgi:hypothetical protein
MADLQWMSAGGLVLDGTGDIALTINDYQDLQSMIVTYLQANSNSWQLYNIGANLGSIPGNANNAEVEATVVKQIQSALSGILPSGSFSIKTLQVGSLFDVYFYINSKLVATTTIDTAVTTS